MKLYGAIDLHSNNNVTVVIDEQDKVVYEKRLPNDLPLIAEQLSGYRDRLQGIVVESTYNWYWLVDGLMDKGHRLHLANTAAIQQYEGLKYTDDHSDARWLAHILRLGVLPQGYIYPKEERAVRDLLRKRSQMVHQRTANLLSIQNLVTRNTGSSIRSNRIKTLDSETVDALLPNPDLALAVKANLAMIQCADEQIDILERTVTERIKLRATRRAGQTKRKDRAGSCSAMASLFGVQPSQDRAGHRADSGADDHAGDRRDTEIFHGGRLRVLLPVCRESEVKQR